MKKQLKSQQFIAQNIKINASTCSYPVRKVAASAITSSTHQGGLVNEQQVSLHSLENTLSLKSPIQ